MKKFLSLQWIEQYKNTILFLSMSLMLLLLLSNKLEMISVQERMKSVEGNSIHTIHLHAELINSARNALKGHKTSKGIPLP